MTARPTDEERAALRHLASAGWLTINGDLMRALLDERDALEAEVERLRAEEQRRRERLDVLTGKRGTDE